MDDRELDARLTYLQQLCESIWEQVKPKEEQKNGASTQSNNNN